LFGPPPLTWPGAYLAAHDDVQEELEDAESSDEEPESTNAKAVVQSDQDTDSDVEPELSVDVSVKYPTLHFQNFVRPHATGAKAPPYQLLDDLPPEQGRDRLIFIDFIHPRYPKLKGGITIFLLLMDYKTGYAMYRPLVSRDDAADAFGVIAISRGWHKCAHVVHAVPDGEPKLFAEIAKACYRLGMSVSTSVPGKPQSNRAGSNLTRRLRRMVDCGLADASKHARNIDGSFEAYAWAWAVDIYNILSNPNDIDGRSPYELANDLQPVFRGAPFGTPGYMHLGANGRRAHIKRNGRPGMTCSEPILWMGFFRGHHQVLTTRGTRRCGPVCLDFTLPLGLFPGEQPDVEKLRAPAKRTPRVAAVAPEDLAAINMFTAADAACKLVAGQKRPNKRYIAERCDSMLGLTLREALQRTFVTESGTILPYRRKDLDYDLERGYLCVEIIPPDVPGEEITLEQVAGIHSVAMLALVDEPDSEVYAMDMTERAAHKQQLNENMAQKGLSWKQFLHPVSPHREAAAAAWDKEVSGVEQKGVMFELDPSHPEYAIAMRDAIKGKPLLDMKRDGELKGRAVLRGDTEDVEATDGIGYDYYAGVASRAAVRLAVLRPGRYELQPGETEEDRIELSTRDICMAFCQSNEFGDGRPRYVKFRSPVDRVWRYYKLLKPLYGARSAPKRWQLTFAEWAVSSIEQGGPGMTRGKNEPSIFSRKATDTHGALTLVLWVDDLLLLGKRRDHVEFYRVLDNRFECKPPKWLSSGVTLDHLGLYIHQCEQFTWIHMAPYIRNMQKILNMAGCKPMYVPISKYITNLKDISDTKKVWFRTALGMCGWLSCNIRIDGAYAYSIIAQYTAHPTQGAYDALVDLVRYYVATQNLAIRQSLYGNKPWTFWSDSDFASNAAPGNKRRSQLGEIAMWGDAPIQFAARVSTVQMGYAPPAAGFRSLAPPVTAHPTITQEHVAQSSAEAETYALALCMNGLLALSYTCDEANIAFPRPAVVNVDNTAAIAFSKPSGGTGRTRLKHIDVRSEWVTVLRESGLVTTAHVDTGDQLADILTKILDQDSFTRLRDKLMHWCPFV
jgi:hypothetical protein